MKIPPKTIRILILLIAVWLIISPQTSLAQNTQKILILPFDLRTDAKYEFLKTAYTDMLFTRLSGPGRAIIVAEDNGTAEMPPATAIQIARQKEADYVVIGSVILLDNAIGTQAEFIGVAEEKALISFNQKGLKPGDIITQIDNFTAQVNADFFNPSAFTEDDTTQSDVPDDIYLHPEKLVIPQTPSE